MYRYILWCLEPASVPNHAIHHSPEKTSLVPILYFCDIVNFEFTGYV